VDDEGAERQRVAGVYRRYADDARFGKKWDATNPGNLAIERERNEVLRARLVAHSLWPLGGSRIADIGCGNGGFLAELVRWGAPPRAIVGVDVLADRLAMARTVSSAHLVNADARTVPLRHASVRLVVAFTLFSSVLADRYTLAIARELDRILEPGGAVVWYDYRVSDPRNNDTRALRRADIEELFPGFHLDLRAVTLVPQLARRLGPATSTAYHTLARLPLLRTHYAGLIVKRR